MARAACLAVFATGLGFGSACAWAEGALALGVPENVAKDGFAYGWAFNMDTASEAKEGALEACRTTKEGSKQAKKLCRIYDTFSNQCVAISMDPDAGTPGVGWSIADNRASAEKAALANCKATAGTARMEFCEISTSKCDGTAE